MLTLRNTTGAFLMNGDDFLLMKRSATRKLNPGSWASVGGHLESHEFSNPRDGCIREIFEETGIKENNISNLELKYIILRRELHVVGVQYVYFGISNTKQLIETDEGELSWVNKNKLLNRELPIFTKAILEHYLEFGNTIRVILVGTINEEQKRVIWTPLHDSEGIR